MKWWFFAWRCTAVSNVLLFLSNGIARLFRSILLRDRERENREQGRTTENQRPQVQKSHSSFSLSLLFTFLCFTDFHTVFPLRSCLWCVFVLKLPRPLYNMTRGSRTTADTWKKTRDQTKKYVLHLKQNCICLNA